MDEFAISVIVSFLFIITGIFGLILPTLPGALFIWLGIVSYGVLNPHVHWHMSFYVIEGFLAASTYVIDYVATFWGVKKFKGTKAGAVGAVLGLFFVFIMGPGGIIVGPFLGAILGELIAGGELRQALRSGFGSFVGFIAALFLRLLICGFMIAWFITKVIQTLPHPYLFHF